MLGEKGLIDLIESYGFEVRRNAAERCFEVRYWSKGEETFKYELTAAHTKYAQGNPDALIDQLRVAYKAHLQGRPDPGPVASRYMPGGPHSYTMHNPHLFGAKAAGIKDPFEGDSSVLPTPTGRSVAEARVSELEKALTETARARDQWREKASSRSRALTIEKARSLNLTADWRSKVRELTEHNAQLQGNLAKALLSQPPGPVRYDPTLTEDQNRSAIPSAPDPRPALTFYCQGEED